MPSTLVSCSSCSMTISCSTSCGLAPGQSVVTVMIGIVTSGVSCIGIRMSAIDAEQRHQQHADGDFHRVANKDFDEGHRGTALRNRLGIRGAADCRQPRVE